MDVIKLEIFTDFVCPWCYLITPRVETLKRNFEFETEWAFFPLHPDTPAEGRSLEDLFAGRGLDLDAMHARMKGLMDAEGLPYNNRTHTYNSRLAQELAKAFPSLHDALYKAYFVEGRNIGDIETLVEISQSAGISQNKRALFFQRERSKRLLMPIGRRLVAMALPACLVLWRAAISWSAHSRTR